MARHSGQTEGARSLSEQLHISPILAQLLVHRGITSAECGRHFLYDSLEQSCDPFLMKGMEKAVQRICRAIEGKEKIIIYGDYDVDGITATSLLYWVLSDLGAEPSFIYTGTAERRVRPQPGCRTAFEGRAYECADYGGLRYFLLRYCRFLPRRHGYPRDGSPRAAGRHTAGLRRAESQAEGCAYPFKEPGFAGVALQAVPGLCGSPAARPWPGIRKSPP